MTMTHAAAISKDLQSKLDELARAARILAMWGHEDQIAGHVSMRDPEGRGLWIKRGEMGLSEITGSDFNLIDMDGKVLSGPGPHHSEWPIHTQILRARPDLNYVAHSHSPYVVLQSCMAEPLRPYLSEIFFARPGRFNGSERIRHIEQGDALAAAMGQSNAVILRNHGSCFAGRTLAELCVIGVRLERACEVHVKLSQSGAKTTELDMDPKYKSPPLSLQAYEKYYRYYGRMLDRAEGAGLNTR